MTPLGLSRHAAWRFTLPAIRVVGRIMWRLRIEYEQQFPDPPFVVAANHHSFLDPPLLGAAYGRRLRFMALASLFGTYPLLDHAFDAFEVIKIGRGTVPLTALHQALDHLADGGVVAVFPEGTRATTWGAVPRRRGAAWLARRAEVPLVAVAIVGTDRVLGLDNKLRRGTIRIRVGPSFRADGNGPAAVDGLHRRWESWVADALADLTSGAGRR
ncbi:MAG: lysophospholipid acyltransferase family protein [Acidimicrobiia bacterium]